MTDDFAPPLHYAHAVKSSLPQVIAFRGILQQDNFSMPDGGYAITDLRAIVDALVGAGTVFSSGAQNSSIE